MSDVENDRGMGSSASTGNPLSRRLVVAGGAAVALGAVGVAATRILPGLREGSASSKPLKVEEEGGPSPEADSALPVMEFPHTYTTRLYGELGEPGPALSFGYPDSWRIQASNVDAELGSEYVQLAYGGSREAPDFLITFDYTLMRFMEGFGGGTVRNDATGIKILGDAAFKGAEYPDLSEDFFNSFVREMMRQYGFVNLYAPPKQSKRDLESMRLSVVEEDIAPSEFSDSLGLKATKRWEIIPKFDSDEEALACANNCFYMAEGVPATSPFYYGWLTFSADHLRRDPTEQEREEIIGILASLKQAPALDGASSE